MISVIKDWAAFLLSEHRRFATFEDLLSAAVGEAHLALRRTTFQLPVLKRHNVVDAGAEGFVRFLEGMNRGFESSLPPAEAAENGAEVDVEVGVEVEAALEVSVEPEKLNFRFCTEATLISTGVDKEILLKHLRKFGDSLLVSPVRDGFKIHLHTNQPVGFFEEMTQLGLPTQGKIDDMFLQEAVRRKRKRTVAVLSDSIADLPEEYKLEQQIHTLPLSLLLGGVAHIDKRSIDPVRVFSYIDSHQDFPGTSLPDPGRVRRQLEELAAQYDSILVITVSGRLSGTYQIVRKEAERFVNSGTKVTVIDSLLNSGAQGLLVKKAAELLDDGKTLEETVSALLETRARTRIYVALHSIANAVKGGRVPKTLGRAAMALGARPVMSLDGEGRGVTFGIGFSQQAMIRKILKLVGQKAKQPGIESYCIVHGDNAMAAEQFAADLTRIVGFGPAYVTEVSSVTAIHAGKGCVAVSFTENRRERSPM
jgi:DegV family protein with EDD domain